MCEPIVSSNVNVGSSVNEAKDFLIVHDRLKRDLDAKSIELRAFAAQLANVPHSEKHAQALRTIIEQWDRVEVIVERRCRFSATHLELLQLANRLNSQIDTVNEFIAAARTNPHLLASVPDTSLTELDSRCNAVAHDLSELERLGSELLRELATQTELARAGTPSTNAGAKNMRLDNQRATSTVESTIQQARDRASLMRQEWNAFRESVASQRNWQAEWTTFMQEARRTIDDSTRVEFEFFPAIAGELGGNADATSSLQKRLHDFVPSFHVRIVLN